MRLRWFPSPEGGWIDVERGLLHRRGQGTTESKKRQPSAPLHKKLLLHARYWQTADRRRGIGSVIHYDGLAIKGRVKRSWETVRKMAGHPRKDSPHIPRHTAATWLMQTGIDLAQIAGYLGMTVKTLETVYGHHHPGLRPGNGLQDGVENESRSPENPRFCWSCRGGRFLREQGVESSNLPAPTST
jgi:integrase